MRGLCVLVLLVAGAVPSRADPGHEIAIEAITRQLALMPDNAELYFQRGYNWREKPDLKEARADFEKALTLAPHYLPATRELARLDAGEGRVADGILRLEKAIAAAPADTPDLSFHLPACYETLAGLLLTAQRNDEALAAAKSGIGLTPQMMLDLYLFRAEAQRRLGRHDERVRDLAEAMTKLRSFVLRIAWIEALIDAKRTEEALPEIQKEIDTSRFTASWLIRRARCLKHLKKESDAAADLTNALAEIESRLRPERPELSLLCERALIHALQGRTEDARTELDDAKKRGADGWMTRVAESVLAESAKPAAPAASKAGP